MNRTTTSLLGAALVACMIPTMASAQDTTQTKRDSAAARSGMRFDPNQTVTLTGVTVIRIDSSAAGGMGGGMSGMQGSTTAGSATTGSSSTGSTTGSTTGSSTGSTMGTTPPAGAGRGGMGTVHAVVQSGTDSINVALAPSEFLASRQLTIKAGDVIDVSGMQMAMGGQKMLVATEVSKGGTKVMLRDKSTGQPVWGAAKSGSTPPSGMTPPSPTPPIE